VLFRLIKDLFQLTNQTGKKEKSMKIKILVCGLILACSWMTSAGAASLGDTITDVVKTLSGLQPKVQIGGDAVAEADINGVGGIVNVGVGVGGAIDAKQKVASIVSGSISGNATAKATINGVGGIVNVGVAVGSINVTDQAVGTIGAS
jgi:hypothetical protein